jgi:NADPH:quinone reductase-like Zn-dependent oxidoreductase
MRAVGYQDPAHRCTDALLDIELSKPVAVGRDLLVEIRAVSVNPVDTGYANRPIPMPGTGKC